jgi:hypothetical protein
MGLHAFTWRRKRIEFPKRRFLVLKFRTIYKVQCPSNFECHTPSSESFRSYILIYGDANSELILSQFWFPLEPYTRSRCYWRSVGQWVSVSSSVRGSGQDVCLCFRVTVLSLWHHPLWPEDGPLIFQSLCSHLWKIAKRSAYQITV